MGKKSLWKVPSYTRADGNKLCWVVENKPRPKSICRCFGPKGEEHARLIVRARNSHKDLLAVSRLVVDNYGPEGMTSLQREAFPRCAKEYDMAKAAVAKATE